MTNTTSSTATITATITNTIQDERFLLESLTIGTHNGVFHADDVCAIAIINLFRWEYALPHVKVMRSRDPKIWGQCDILVDVGEGIYDHHGTSYSINQWRDEPDMPACAFSKVLEALAAFQNWNEKWFDALELPAKVVSCIDNGKPDLIPDGVNNPFCWVHSMNTPWNWEDTSLSYDNEQDLRFAQAVRTAENILAGLIESGFSDIHAESERETILAGSGPDRNFNIEIPCGLPGWQHAVCEFWDADYVSYLGKDQIWYIQCVPQTAAEPFSKRKPLPEEWAGARDKDLGARIAQAIPDFNPEDAVFCHIGRFLIGIKTKEAKDILLEYLATKVK